MTLSNGWTGGQYSLYRAILGASLALHLAQLLPWGGEFPSAGIRGDASAGLLYSQLLADAPALAGALLALGVVAAAALALGVADRAAALLLCVPWTGLLTRDALIANPGVPFTLWLLLLHALLPRNPYGAWHARGRPDAGNPWRLPPGLFAALWILMSLGYTSAGLARLGDLAWVDGGALAPLTWGVLALELLFAPLALLRRVRPWLWAAMWGVSVGRMLWFDTAGASFGMVLLQLIAFDPAWMPARGRAEPATMFYDGSCGLCHRAVRFMLSEDRDGRAFRFAALEGETFRGALPESARASLPDSIVVLTAEGELRVRSDAMIEAGHRLGGLWRVLAWLLERVPRALRDAVYDRIATVRQHLFARPADACPIVPADLRARFEP